jgi:hypothetical protein
LDLFLQARIILALRVSLSKISTSLILSKLFILRLTQVLGLEFGEVSNILYENIVMDTPIWWGIYIGPQ